MSIPSSSPRPADEAARLLEIVDRFSEPRVLVIGDFIADEFIYGRVARISREAPVLILEYDRTQVVPGGAGNAASNVASLGARTRAVGLVGDDEIGKRMIEGLHENIERTGVIARSGELTPTKTRILAGGVHSAKQQVVRIDRITRAKADAQARELFRREVLRAAPRYDAVLVSDYGAGLVSPSLVSELKKAVAKPGGNARGGGARRVPILLDSRYDLGRYRGLTAITPNEAEVEAALGISIHDSTAVLERAGRELLERTKNQAVLITRGSHGMALFERDQPTRHLGIYGSDEISDVTGAGDTVIATMTLALAAGASPYQAMQLANYAGGIVVMKRGTATVSPHELRQAVRDDLRARSRPRRPMMPPPPLVPGVNAARLNATQVTAADRPGEAPGASGAPSGAASGGNGVRGGRSRGSR
jgi:D-glycero-beta-D-manno-heptose-7-phosphate kinase